MDGERGSAITDNRAAEEETLVLQALCSSGICVFRYYPLENRVEIPGKLSERFKCPLSIGNIPYGFSETFIYPDDRDIYNELYERVLKGEHSASATVRSRDLYNCWKVTLTTVRRDQNGQPLEVVGVHENANESYLNEKLPRQIEKNLTEERSDKELDEVMKIVSSAISTRYDALYHIWVKERKYVVLQESLQGVIDVLGEKGDYMEAWERFVKTFVAPDDRAAAREFYDIETLPERLRNHDTISFNYRRIGTGWAQGRYIVGKRDEKGEVTNVIFTASNINDEVERELKQREDAYEAEHDSLTGLFNRKGFMRSISEEDFLNGKTGLVLIDIDNFKALNDCHGHELGDQVLTTVADELTQAFRSDDRLFRMGGDEIAVLLHDCGPDAWPLLCAKFKRIHSSLAGKFSEGLSVDVTLSAGLCFSDAGYSTLMYQLADEALYETKQNGRAGCTLIGLDHRVLQNWHDDEISLRTENALQYLNSGMFRMELPIEKTGGSPRLITGENTRIAFGLPASATTEECFLVWKKGIAPDYWPMLKKAARTMLEEGHADCTYMWIHPRFGKMYVRSNGFGEKREGMNIISGYHHVLRNTKIIEKEDDKDLLFKALNDVYFASYYLDLETDTIYIFKMAPGEEKLSIEDRTIPEIIEEYVSFSVDEKDREKLRSFLDMSTVDDRMKGEHYLDCEYRSLALDNWCRAKLIPIKRNAGGKLTNLLFVLTALDSTKSEELSSIDFNRKSLSALFNNVPGGIVMYEWNGEKLRTLHLSEYYRKEYGDTLTGDDGGPDFNRVHPDDLPSFRQAVAKALLSTHELHYTYRVWNRNKKSWLWVKIDAISEEQANGTSLVYAIYTDCTEQKVAEQKLEKRNAAILASLDAGDFYIYEYDPVEHTSTFFSDRPVDYDLDNVITNYPECFRTSPFMHPDDVEKFIATVRRIDNGEDSAHCDIRVHKGEQLRWHSCTFDAFYDREKERRAAILTVVDVTDKMITNAEYNFKLKSFDLISGEALSAGYINLNRNTFDTVHSGAAFTDYDQKSMSYDELLPAVAKMVVGAGSKRRYLNLFNRENLLAGVEKGIMHVQTDFLCRFPEKHTVWVEAITDLVRNPVNGEIEGLCYAKDIQNVKFSSLLMKKTLNLDYPMLSVIVTDTDEFYTFDTRTGTYEQPRYDFWKRAPRAMAPIVLNMSQEQLEEKFDKATVLEYLKNHQDYSFTFTSNVFGGESRVECKCSYLSASGSLMLTYIRNITDDTLLEKYKYDSEHDSLTGLLTRKAQFKACRRLLAEHPEEQFVMLHCDVKKFHLYNTFYGDEAGDRLLCKVAELMTRMGKHYDCWAYARIESDVFAAFFPAGPGLFESHVRLFLEEMAAYSEDFPVEFALGAYYVTDPTMSIEAMFSRATIAAKSGKINLFGLISRYDENMEKELMDTHQITTMMQSAVAEEQFKVYLQPQYSLRNGRLVGAESLVRWQHPERGMISPGAFIPVFEKNGFIATLDRYMWEHVCILLRKWLDEGRKVFPVSVNISRVSMYSHTTVPLLKSLVEKYRLEPRYLELELTESAYMDDPEDLKRMLKDLQSYGFKILMDDFGSGYSSLTTLRELPVDVLKLDMKFLSVTQQDRRASAVLASVVRMSKLLSLPVVAEGVETAAQAEFLRSIGCEYVQGYYFAHPMPVKDYEALAQGSERFMFDEAKIGQNLVDQLYIGNTLETQLTDQFPVPMGLVEFSSGKFIFLRANNLFIEYFNLTDDTGAASASFRDHLSAEDFEKLTSQFAHCSNERVPVCLKFDWHEDGHVVYKYVANAAYKGEIGYSKILLASFTRISGTDKNNPTHS